MTRIVTALERAGLVTKEAHTRDARAIHIRATNTGKQRLHEGRARRIASLAAKLDRIAPNDAAILDRAARIMEHVVQISD